MKAHIGADSESGLVHSVVGTAANVADVAGGQAAARRREPGQRRCRLYRRREACRACRPLGHLADCGAAQRLPATEQAQPLYKAKRKIEAKAQVRAKVEHPFRVIKRQFGYTKVRFRGLAKNTAQLITLFALSNLWMARRHLLANTGEVRL